MSLPIAITIPGDVMARHLADETVLLHLASGNYYGLDAVGTRVWQLAGEGRKVADICDVLLSEFDVPREQLEADLERLLQELSAQGLVTLGEGPARQ